MPIAPNASLTTHRHHPSTHSAHRVSPCHSICFSRRCVSDCYARPLPELSLFVWREGGSSWLLRLLRRKWENRRLLGMFSDVLGWVRCWVLCCIVIGAVFARSGGGFWADGVGSSFPRRRDINRLRKRRMTRKTLEYVFPIPKYMTDNSGCQRRDKW